MKEFRGRRGNVYLLRFFDDNYNIRTNYIRVIRERSGKNSSTHFLAILSLYICTYKIYITEMKLKLASTFLSNRFKLISSVHCIRSDPDSYFVYLLTLDRDLAPRIVVEMIFRNC